MRRLILVAVVLCLNGVVSGQTPDQPMNAESREELQKRITQLEKELRILEGIVEGTAGEVNLGRTSLAAVSASSVNGGRALDNKYYGIVNAFDNGTNWHNNINYSYWLGGGGANEWIELNFDHPVTVVSIHLETTVGQLPGFQTLFTLEKGGEKTFPQVSRDLKLPQKMHGVKRIRLTLGQPLGNALVNEIRVMGYVPPGVKYRVENPRLHMTKKTAVAIAQAEFEKWRFALALPSTSNTKEDEQQVTVTFSADGMTLLRVTINKATGNVTKEVFAKLVPARQPVEEIPVEKDPSRRPEKTVRNAIRK